MKIVVPEPHVELYKEGFGDTDNFLRKNLGKQLSELVERIEGPLVIALNGGWGSGKSFFLKRWVGAHQMENDGKAATIYFDAFSHDYLDDPLIALTGTISEKFKSKSKLKKTMNILQSNAAKLFKPAVRISLAAATAGASEIAGVAVNAALETGSKELGKASDEFWKKENGKRAAMYQFRDALKKLTNSGGDEDDAQKLVIVIDELDRCRPDYALAMLETVKHFFEVPHVHFVLGVNLAEMENSVKIRYGAEVNSRLYLQKFINLSMELPKKQVRHAAVSYELDHFSNAAKSMNLNETMVESVSSFLERILPNEMLSFRGIEKLLTNLALVPQVPDRFDQLYPGYQSTISCLLLMKTIFPHEYQKALNGTISMDDVKRCFGTDIEGDEQFNRGSRFIENVWSCFLAPNLMNNKSDRSRLFGMGELSYPKEDFSNLIRDYLENVNLGLPNP